MGRVLRVNKGEPARWCISREIHGKEWRDGAIVYDAASGDTHHLSLPAFHILALIQDSPLTQEEIAARMLPALSSAPNEEFLLTLEAIVNNLHALGFIEPARH